MRSDARRRGWARAVRAAHDWVYLAEPMTAEDARELIAGIEAALDHVDAMALEREATRIAAPAVIGPPEATLAST